MVLQLQSEARAAYRDLMLDMYGVRKAVFVDQLGWDVPVIDGHYEVDQFDTDEAVYLINFDPETGKHLASVRLLPTTRAHILGDLFPQLCVEEPLRDEETWEITRLCTTPGLDRVVAAKARHKLAVALVEHALLHGITRYVIVIEIHHLSALIAPGWRYRPLGPPTQVGAQMLGAFELGITPTTLELMRARWGGEYPVLSYPEHQLVR